MANLTTNKPDDLLDPGFDNQPGDYTRYSRGYDSDRSAGTRIGAVGDFIKDKFAADDAFLKQRTREEATTETDKIRNLFSGLDQRQGGWTLEAIGVTKGNAVVEEIKKRMDRLGKLDQAYASGRVTGTHYWTMLDVAARELRSKYPGYREHIDNVFSDLTGATPANQVVAGIRQDATRDRQNDPDKQLKRMVEEAAQNGYLHKTGFHAGPDGLPRDASGKPADLGTFTNAVSKVRGVHYDRQDAKARLEVDAAAGRANENDVEKNAQGRIDDVGDGYFRTVTGVFGDPEQLQKKIDALSKDAAAGKPLAGDELIKVQAEMAQHKTAYMRAVEKELAETPNVKMLSHERRKAIRESAETRWGQFEDIIYNRNYGLASYNKAWTDSVGNSDVAKLIDRNETARQMNMINKWGGPDLVRNYLSANPASMNDVQKLLKAQSLTKILSTGAPIHQEIETAARRAGITNVEYYDTIVDQTVKAVLDPKSPKEVVDNGIKSLYGPMNSNFLYRYENGTYVPTFKNTAKMQEYYAKLTSPEMTKRVLELSQSTNDPTYWTNYYGWTTRTLTNNGEFNRALQDVKRLSTETDQPFGVRYDPTTSTLSVVQRPVINTRRDSGGLMYPSYKAKVEDAVNTFNRMSQPMREIFKHTKEDPSKFFDGLFTLNGMNPTDLTYKPVR
jgi:hypothetical protein